MTRITVLGGSGFIGSQLIEALRQRNLEYFAPAREENLSGQDLGTVIYCIGLTADFRTRPFDTVSAHVCRLLEIIRDCQFQSFIYLSTTRLYSQEAEIAREEDSIIVRPLDTGDLYNISKAMGESLALTATTKSTIVRLSNVYGPEFNSTNFLSSIIRAALNENKITLTTALDSEKDYVDVRSVVDVLVAMALRGCDQRIYNLASGANCANREVANKLAQLTHCEVEVKPGSPRIRYPRIDISRLKKEFDFNPGNVLDDMEGLVNFHRSVTGSLNDLN